MTHQSRCWCHTAHLAVLDVFAKVEHCHKMHRFVKHLVNLFAHQRLLSDLLEREQLEEQGSIVLRILNDCKTRWYSTFSMLLRVYELWPRIRSVLSSAAAKHAATAKERPVISELVSEGDLYVRDLPFLLTILRVIHDATKVMESDSGFSSIAIFIQDNVENSLKVSVFVHLNARFALCHCFQIFLWFAFL